MNLGENVEYSAFEILVALSTQVETYDSSKVLRINGINIWEEIGDSSLPENESKEGGVNLRSLMRFFYHEANVRNPVKLAIEFLEYFKIFPPVIKE